MPSGILLLLFKNTVL